MAAGMRSRRVACAVVAAALVLTCTPQLSAAEWQITPFSRQRQVEAYSAYARALESIKDAYRLLDSTLYGRQQDSEDSPRCWPHKPTYT
jgi:hypothetical protein